MPNYAVVLCLCGSCLEQPDTAANKDEHVLLTLFQIPAQLFIFMIQHWLLFFYAFIYLLSFFFQRLLAGINSTSLCHLHLLYLVLDPYHLAYIFHRVHSRIHCTRWCLGIFVFVKVIDFFKKILFKKKLRILDNLFNLYCSME